ncbi:MAG: (2Fe-2S) ferredoxin domain-containing protein [Mucinivorans sp.]
MTQKIIVKLCSGTLCYVMGGAELQLLSDALPAEIVDKVEIRGSACLDFCNKPQVGKAPFVMVGDQLITSATVSKVIDEIMRQNNGSH